MNRSSFVVLIWPNIVCQQYTFGRFRMLCEAKMILWHSTSTTDTAVALVSFCSWELWCFCRKPNIIWTVWKYFNSLWTEWKLLILSGSLFGISSRLESSLQFGQKPLLGFCHLWTVFELNTQRSSLAQARARETECVLKRCFVVWSDLSERARKVWLTFV